MPSHSLKIAATLAVVAACHSALAGSGLYPLYLSGGARPESSSVDANFAAMDKAFPDYASVGWDYATFDDGIATDFGFSGYSFIFVDSTAGSGTDLDAFLTVRGPALHEYLHQGGRLFINVHSTTGVDLNTFGVTLQSGDADFGTLTIEGGKKLSGLGAGSSWGAKVGEHFATYSITTSPALVPLLTDGSGHTLVAAGTYEGGYLMIGTQTDFDLHAGLGGSDPAQLRINELVFAGGPNAELTHLNVSSVPEPETYALMAAGLGTILMLARRRQAED